MTLPNTTRLRTLIAHRDRLRPHFDRAWHALHNADPVALETWSAAALELLDANAGPACQLAFWRLSTRLPLPPATAAGRAAAAICRHAGARAATASLEFLPPAITEPALLDAWWTALQRLAREAPDCVALAAAQAPALLADPQGALVQNFVAAGLKAYAADRDRRRAFFALEDPWARALLTRRPDLPGFDALARTLTAYAAALWTPTPLLRAAPPSDARRPRATISGPVVLLPAALDPNAAPTAATARALYRATVAHAAAHVALPPVQHPIGDLKPLQLAVITLIEDARVEALALHAYPGLRRLWAAFHTAPPSGPRTAPNLMARLARALFDPTHTDSDGFVAKAARLFAEAAAAALDDPAISLRIGRILGNDLGQMRVQFNWRDYVIEPPYRDDGHHLFLPPDPAQTALDLTIQAARPNNRPNNQDDTAQDPKEPNPATTAGRARDTPPDERGIIIATYPEWDSAIAAERPDWTTLRETPARPADPAPLQAALAAQPLLRRRIAGLVRAATIGQPTRLKRQPDGDDLDLDAALDATIDLRAGRAPDPRLYRVTRPRSRDLATLLLLDTSASTAAPAGSPAGKNGPSGPGGAPRTANNGPTGSVLDVQRLAVALLAEALDTVADPVALRAFASDGRADVRLTRIKDLTEPFDAAALARLAGLRSGLSTRLGTALRHARTEFAPTRAWRRLLLVLTDGEPSDIDVPDNADLIHDARRAVLQLRAAGIDVFGVVLDPAGVGSATTIFGRSNTIPISDLADLPARLAGLYFRLARR